jgi:hypothetical protein
MTDDTPQVDVALVPLDDSVTMPLNAYFNTIALLTQTVTTPPDDIVIDRNLGENVKLTLTEQPTSFSVINWPVAPYLGALYLDITNQDSYTIPWPSNYYFTAGTPPTIPSGETLLTLSTTDAGATVRVDVGGAIGGAEVCEKA